MMNIVLNCDVHGTRIGQQIRTVVIKKISYNRCRECQREKDRKHAKKYRDKNKEYYAAKKKEHYNENPHMQMERNRRYRERLKYKTGPDSSMVEQRTRNAQAIGSSPILGKGEHK